MSLFTRQSGGQRAKTVKTHSNNLVMLAHVQLKPFYRLSTRDITHVRKCTRPSPAFPYCKRRKAGRGPGNEATQLPYGFYTYPPSRQQDPWQPAVNVLIRYLTRSHSRCQCTELNTAPKTASLLMCFHSLHYSLLSTQLPR